MEDSKSLDHRDEITAKNINSEAIEIKKNESESKENSYTGINQQQNPNINLTSNNTHNEDKVLEDNNKEFTSKLNINSDKSNNKIESSNNEIIKEKTTEDSKFAFEKPTLGTNTNKLAENIDKVDKEVNQEENKKLTFKDKVNTNIDKDNNNIEKSNNELVKEKTNEDSKLAFEKPYLDSVTNNSAENADKVDKEKKLEEDKKATLKVKSNANIDKNNAKEIPTTNPVKAKAKPVKEPPIEKKPFLEFVNDYLIPEIKNEFKLKGKEINKINLQKTHRPIANDICWVIYCEINDTCNFWLSFERDDITSLKSFSLCKNYEKPSIIESFLIDEKKITLKLIISRILQRLNGQKLIGAN